MDRHTGLGTAPTRVQDQRERAEAVEEAVPLWPGQGRVRLGPGAGPREDLPGRLLGRAHGVPGLPEEVIGPPALEGTGQGGPEDGGGPGQPAAGPVFLAQGREDPGGPVAAGLWDQDAHLRALQPGGQVQGPQGALEKPRQGGEGPVPGPREAQDYEAQGFLRALHAAVLVVERQPEVLGVVEAAGRIQAGGRGVPGRPPGRGAGDFVFLPGHQPFP